MRRNKNTLQNEVFECWAKKQAVLKLPKTALAITLNPKGSAFFYQNSITTSWIVASKCKKKSLNDFVLCVSVCVCMYFFGSPSSQMLDELPWQVSHLQFLLEGKIVQRSATLFIFTVYLPGSGVSGTSQFVYKCNEVFFFCPFFFHRCQVFLGRLTTIFFIPSSSWTTRPRLISTHELCRDLVFEVNPTGLMLLFCTIVCKAGPASWARWCTWGRCRWRTCIQRTTLAKHAN